MIYRIRSATSEGWRELFLRPGAKLSVPGQGRCRLRRIRVPDRLDPYHDDDGRLEALIEWLDADGDRTGVLCYLRLAGLHPDWGPDRCPLDRPLDRPRPLDDATL